jgi:hypothetical protein
MSDESGLPPAGPSSDSSSRPAPIKPTSPVRERTLRHLRRLLAGAALTGTVLEGTGCGFDPLPPPVTCEDGVTKAELNSATWSNAQWVQGLNGLHIQMQVESWTDGDNLLFSGAPSCEGATLESFGWLDWGVTIFCTPTQGVTTVTVSIPMKCGADTDVTLRLALDVSAAPAVGGSIPVAIAD